MGRHPDIRLLTASAGKTGVEMARAETPDLILMDINLPDINGFAALIALRADPAMARIPVIALSANAMSASIDAGIKAGFSRYLTKPINVSEFMVAVDGALRRADDMAPDGGPAVASDALAIPLAV